MGVMNITVDENGGMSVDADGYQGDMCLQELAALQKGLEKFGVKNDLASQKLKRQTMRATVSTKSSRRV